MTRKMQIALKIHLGMERIGMNGAAVVGGEGVGNLEIRPSTSLTTTWGPSQVRIVLNLTHEILTVCNVFMNRAKRNTPGQALRYTVLWGMLSSYWVGNVKPRIRTLSFASSSPRSPDLYLIDAGKNWSENSLCDHKNKSSCLVAGWTAFLRITPMLMGIPTSTVDGMVRNENIPSIDQPIPRADLSPA